MAAAATQPSAAAIVATVADLAHRLGLRTVAEGVEGVATSVLLDTMGYDTQQGFHHARPAPAAAITTTLHHPPHRHPIPADPSQTHHRHPDPPRISQLTSS